MCDIFIHPCKEVEELNEDKEKHRASKREIDKSVIKITINMKNKNEQGGAFKELPKYSKQQNARI